MPHKKQQRSESPTVTVTWQFYNSCCYLCFVSNEGLTAAVYGISRPQLLNHRKLQINRFGLQEYFLSKKFLLLPFCFDLCSKKKQKTKTKKKPRVSILIHRTFISLSFFLLFRLSDKISKAFAFIVIQRSTICLCLYVLFRFYDKITNVGAFIFLYTTRLFF